MHHLGRHEVRGHAPIPMKAGSGDPEEGWAAPPPQGDTSASATIGSASKPVVMRPANPQEAAKTATKKIEGAPALVRKRAYIALDE